MEHTSKLNRISCLSCKKSKRKCDRDLPICTLCNQKNKICVYPEEDKRKPATHKYIKTLLSRIETLESSLSYYTSASLTDLAAQFRSSDKRNVYSGLVSSRLQDKRKQEAARSFDSVNNDFEGNTKGTLYSRFWDDDFESPEKLKRMVNFSNMNQIMGRLSSCHDKDYIFPQWQLNMSSSGEVIFQGPTSLRFISPSNGYGMVKTIKKVEKIEVFDEFHDEVFTWFFISMKNSFPLIDRELFFTSLNQAIEGNELGEYSSMALINSIVSFYFFHKGEKQETLHYKKLSISQLDEQGELNPNITIPQTLVLLSLLSMAQGREMEGSQFIARAVAASSHLGLHVNCENLLFEGKISRQEAQLRDNVFWCCYFVDRARVIVLGMSPYMYPVDISINLPKKPIDTFDSGFDDHDVFREAVIFQDLEFERAYYCFSSDFAFGFNHKPLDEVRIEQKLIVSNALVSINEWKKEMSSNARFTNNNKMAAMQLELAVLTTNLLLSQTLLSEPVKNLNSDPDQENEPQKVAINCLTLAQKIIDLISEYDLSQSLFIYRFIYSIYICCIIFLFTKTSPNSEIKSLSLSYLLKSLKLFKTYRWCDSSVDIFVKHLDKFRQRWFGNEVELADFFDSLKNKEN